MHLLQQEFRSVGQFKIPSTYSHKRSKFYFRFLTDGHWTELILVFIQSFIDTYYKNSRGSDNDVMDIKNQKLSFSSDTLVWLRYAKIGEKKLL